MIKLKCTSCNTKVNAFDKSLTGKPWRCPNCNTPVKMGYNLKMMAIWFLPAIIIGEIAKIFLVNLGYKEVSYMAIGVVLSIITVRSMTLKPINKK